MGGDDIKEFILGRSSEIYGLELEVAGLRYHIHYVGGIPAVKNFNLENGQAFDENKTYRVAVSSTFFFSGKTFPGYKYRNSFNFTFEPLRRMISARDSLKQFLDRGRRVPYLRDTRARVSKALRGNSGPLRISQIQGSSHRSHYYGHQVVTQGIVTAVGSHQWYPGGTEVYIQSETPDNDDRTSE